MKPQRVLLVNKFYYRRGGDCVYLLNLEELLRSRGHEVAVFAMRYPENLPSKWQDYFATEVSFSGGAGEKLRALERTLGIGDIKASFKRLLDDFKPDVVHLNNIHSYLSPVIAGLAKEAGARVAWTLHDYKLLCPAYSCLCRGEICERCFTDKTAVVKRRCMKGSLSASVIALAEAERWNRRKIDRWVDTYICPSEFMAAKMEQGGFPSNKLVTINNFIAPEAWHKLNDRNADLSRSNYYCYIGRLSPEKGVATLLEAASKLPHTLKIAGGGPLASELRERYSAFPQIEWLGHLDGDGVAELLSGARLSVVPSEWYENNPFSVIESLCAGTPVAGASIGGIPELIAEGVNGVTFPSGDAEAMRSAIMRAWSTEWDHRSIASAALERFSPDEHYRAIDKIYRG